MPVVLFLAGLLFLVGGAELLVRGASRLAALLGVPALVVGLTVVAFGTSAPELAVSVKAAVTGQAGLSVGNVLGSNIFNVLFILGVSSIIVPLIVSIHLIKIDVPVMIVVLVLFLSMSFDGLIGVVDGVVLCVLLVSYVCLMYLGGKRHSSADEGEGGTRKGTGASTLVYVAQVSFILAGLALLVVGSDWLVDGAVILARYLGVSDTIIGLTIVSAGTSLPEVATSLVAAVKGERDIAVGNVVGSNIFNILGVMGVSAVVAGGVEVSDSLMSRDGLFMLGVSLLCLPVFFTGLAITRREGALFLLLYVAYTTYLVLTGLGSDLADVLWRVLVWGMMPLSGLVLIAQCVRDLRRR